MSLHIVYTEKGLSACISCAHEEDVILLVGDGVYAAVNNSLFNNMQVKVLSEDAEIRGVDIADLESFTYDDWIADAAALRPIVNWND